MRGAERAPGALIACAPLLFALGCARATFEGARVVSPEVQPGATLVPRLTPADCRDRGGQSAPAPALYVAELVPQSGERAALEVHQDHGALLVTNLFQQGPQRGYAYVSRDHAHHPLLHLLWLGDTTRRSWLEVADRFELRYVDDGFRPSVRRRALLCRLVLAP